MDLSSETFSSTALSANYPAHYKEFQIRNWSHVDIVITDFNGTQHLVRTEGTLKESEACVVIEYRTIDGVRSEITEFGSKEIPIPCKRTIIPFDVIRNSPYRVGEHNIIISTVDHSYVAKEMLTETTVNPLVYETRIDEEILDPRYVFQVIDPNNQWDVLYVNMFGHTVIVRAGHWSHVLGNPKSDDQQTPDKGKLICYLRYPYEYYNGSKAVSTVFEVALDNIENNEPIMLPGGDSICVSPTQEGLQKALAKKAGGNRGQVPANMLSSKMVTKEMYDTAQETHEREIKRIQEESKAKLETIKVQKDNEISKLNFELTKVKQERDSFEDQVKHWENISIAQKKYGENTAGIEEALAKARKEAYDASRKDLDNMWMILKIVGTAAAGILSFGIAAYTKSHKK